MEILKFKKTGDVYFVQYEENEDIKTLKTEDEPENELAAARDNVAMALLQLFKISDVSSSYKPSNGRTARKRGASAYCFPAKVCSASSK